MTFIDEKTPLHWWDRFVLTIWNLGDKFTLALKKCISYKSEVLKFKSLEVNFLAPEYKLAPPMDLFI